MPGIQAFTRQGGDLDHRGVGIDAVDVAAIRRNIHSINPNATVIEVSALTGEGLDAWHIWVRQALASRTTTTPALATA